MSGKFTIKPHFHWFHFASMCQCQHFVVCLLSFEYVSLGSFLGLKKFPHSKGPNAIVIWNRVLYPTGCTYFGSKRQGSIHLCGFGTCSWGINKCRFWNREFKTSSFDDDTWLLAALLQDFTCYLSHSASLSLYTSYRLCCNWTIFSNLIPKKHRSRNNIVRIIMVKDPYHVLLNQDVEDLQSVLSLFLFFYLW